MNVQHSVGKCVEQRLSNESHETGKAHHSNGTCLQKRRNSEVVIVTICVRASTQMYGFNTGGKGARKTLGLRLTGNDDRNGRIQRTCLNCVENCLKIAAPAGNKNARGDDWEKSAVSPRVNSRM